MILGITTFLVINTYYDWKNIQKCYLSTKNISKWLCLVL